MLKIIDKNISQESLEKLNNLQSQINILPSKINQKEKAEFMWQNRTNNSTFVEIREILGKMCNGNERCCYCEDSHGHTIEHIFPKSLFPEKTFVWTNYLYVCSECNSAKNKCFPIFTNNLNFEQAKIESIENYDIVLLNPRQDEPTNYFELDIIDTFQFVNSYESITKEYIRAKQTLIILGLNIDNGKKGEILTEQRKIAFQVFRSHLIRYKILKEENNITEIENMKTYIQKSSHPTVWFEIKRYYKLYPQALKDKYLDIYNIFFEFPEILEI